LYPGRKGKMKSILFRNMHYIFNYGTGQEELYNLSLDLDEAQDLAAKDPGLLEQYRHYLQALIPQPAKPQPKLPH
jgi:hypothetical protein